MSVMEQDRQDTLNPTAQTPPETQIDKANSRREGEQIGPYGT
jgi:hypothetical protein